MYYLNIVRFGKRNIRETYNGSASETRAYASKMLTKYKGEYVDVAFRPEGGKVIPQGFVIKLPSGRGWMTKKRLYRLKRNGELGEVIE